MSLHSEALEHLYDCAQLAVNFSGFQASDDNEVVMLRDALKDAKTALAALAGGGEVEVEALGKVVRRGEDIEIDWVIEGGITAAGEGCWLYGIHAIPVPEDGAVTLYTHPAGAVQVDAIRTAVADYMRSEGCSCCRDSDAHEVHAERLAKLLGVAPYADGDGYDFSPYRTALNPGGSRE